VIVTAATVATRADPCAARRVRDNESTDATWKEPPAVREVTAVT
jgi:hypothetical protein